MQNSTIKTNANGYVRASHSEGIKGFDDKAWKNSLTDEQRRKLRCIRSKAGRDVHKQITAIRKAAKALISINKSIKKQAEEVVGGQQSLKALFGCENPLSFDMDPGFEDILEATDDIHAETEQFAASPSTIFYLPQEDDDDAV